MRCIINSFDGKRIFQNDDIESIMLYSAEGAMTLLNEHENIEGSLINKRSEIVIRYNEEERVILNIFGGFFKIYDNEMKIVCFQDTDKT